MARTGIDITVTNTQLGAPPQVNSNSMIIVCGAKAVSSGDMPFVLNAPYILYSASDLKKYGIDSTNNAAIVEQVGDYFAPSGTISNAGNVLWLVGTATTAGLASTLEIAVRKTVTNGFQYRPRQIAVYADMAAGSTELDAVAIQASIANLYTDGFSLVAVLATIKIEGSITTAASTTLPDFSTSACPFVGKVIVTNRLGKGACVGLVLGYMAAVSVGTSIGDGTLPQIGGNMYFLDTTGSGMDVQYLNTPVASVATAIYNALGDKQYIFSRTRPPKNGLWFNDGATGEDATTALSTLEAGRTIAAIVDDLRAYFVPYINGRVPVNTDGDIRGDYKQVVLDGANSRVMQPYVTAGDISSFSLDIQAKNNDFLGTRTWEVTVSILPAFTLRWIDGYVFYVNALS